MSGDACECAFHGHHDPDDAECLATVEHAGTTLACSRPVDHDGPHAACTVVEHPVTTWADAEEVDT